MKLKTFGKDNEEIINSTYNDLGNIIKKLKEMKSQSNKCENKISNDPNKPIFRKKTRISIDIPTRNIKNKINNENTNSNVEVKQNMPNNYNKNEKNIQGDEKNDINKIENFQNKLSNTLYNNSIEVNSEINAKSLDYLGNNDSSEIELGNRNKKMYFHCINFLETPDKSVSQNYHLKVQINNPTYDELKENHNNTQKHDNLKIHNNKRKILKFKNITIKIPYIIPDKKFFSLLCPTIIDFNSLGDEKVIKIGEASYSEVFYLKGCAYKIIPISNNLHDFCKEAYINKILSGEKGILGIKEILIIRGKYPDNFLQAWCEFAKKSESENIDPVNYTDSQIYGVIAMDRKPYDLEKYNFRNENDVVDVFTQILNILSNLEKKYEFEHRDLHLGNILLDDSNGLDVFVIDFTLSRLRSNKGVIFTDLNKEIGLFDGDENVDTQYKVYRDMRFFNDKLWSVFNPFTNILWLRYLLKKFDKYKKSLEKITREAYRAIAVHKMLL
ncbi:Serine/threonine-protein kinase haspin like protein hrk1 [Dictyocoela muelleri]|nr:Serine/threonine-protein kinase haspin like protein hrk1 [Dictyocoela muelleri]